MKTSGSFYVRDIKDSRLLMKVASGEEKADMAIINAKLLNVYSGELLDQHSIGIKGKWIACVGDDLGDVIGQQTKVIDAKGQTVIPGLIDGHTHLLWFITPYEFLKHAIKGGTTTVITETLEAFPVGGYKGVTDFLSSINEQPIKIFATATTMPSISKTARGAPMETIQKLLGRSDILGMGETYWQSVLKEPDRLLPIHHETLRFGKVLEGHSAGAKGKKLMAYIASGISSCHEPITAEEALERLRLGLYVMIREGSVRRDLEAVSRIKDFGIDLRRLILVSDGLGPKDLIEKGGMEFIVQKAIDCGFDPISAIQMATLNVAEHFSLDGLIGGIAPGRFADMVIIPDSNTIDAQYVISEGQLIAKDGRLLVPPREHTYSSESLNSIHLPEKLNPSDFKIRVEKNIKKAEVRIIEQVTSLVTKEAIITLPVVQNEIRADVSRDILKVAAIDRTHCPGKMFVGFVKGFHMHRGAFATSGAWDTSDIIVVGTSDEDMAVAVNRIHDIQGGVVVSANKEIIAEFPLPILGILSDLPVEMVLQKMEEVNMAVLALGIPFNDPLTTLAVLTTAAIPYLRICEEGLVDLRNDITLEVIVDHP
ncbi:MAG: adenine deaminase C-terminal domain-containing protein [Pseudomonadota bacterium]